MEPRAPFGAGPPLPGYRAMESAPTREHIEEELTELRKRLEGRDADVRTLKRDLGVLEQRLAELESPERPARGGVLAIWSKARGGIARLWRRTAGRRVEPAAHEWTARSERYSDPLFLFTEAVGEARIICVTAFGLSRGELPKVLDTVEGYCRKRGAVPVLLTDSDCFDLFRERDMIFEFLPPADQRERFALDLPWPLYFQRRLAIFKRKWRPVGIVSFGTRAPVEGLQKVLEPDPDPQGT